MAEYLQSLELAGRSRGHLHHVEKALKPFLRGRRHMQVRKLHATMIEQWLNANGWAPRTKAGYLMDVRAMCNFAIRRGYLSLNPALGVPKPRIVDAPPGIHTAEQVKAVLEAARRTDVAMLRCLAIQYFAGLRTSEAIRLEESEIRLEQGYIEVMAAKAKTRQRRLVVIQPNLALWLAQGGRLPLHDPNTRFARFRASVDVPWPRNVCRHSFCTYHLAMWENAGRTALEAGHTEPMLFGHYRALATRAEAERYWAVRP